MKNNLLSKAFTLFNLYRMCLKLSWTLKEVDQKEDMEDNVVYIHLWYEVEYFCPKGQQNLIWLELCISTLYLLYSLRN